MTFCDKKSISNLQTYITHVTNFLHQYKWIQDAYVSDFFYRDHWEKLPTGWTDSLSQLSTEELSWLVDKSQIKISHVVPLSLLSFRACSQAFSIDRQPAWDIESKWRDLVSKKSDIGCSGCELRRNVSDQTNCSNNSHNHSYTAEQMSKAEYMGPVDKDGMLHYFYKKHVKPKKQHEIMNQAKVIQLLSNQIGCSHVVDVGGGLGHLSRLLSFGYGLRVTSVEASDGHAPKANKYDREVDKEIKKKNSQADTESSHPAVSTNLPHHVTSMIYPNMTANDFLAIIKAQDHMDPCSGAINNEHSHKTTSKQCNNTEVSYHMLVNKHNLQDGVESQIASKVAKLDNHSIDNRDKKENIKSCHKLTTLESYKIDISRVSPHPEAIDLNDSKSVQNSKCDKIETDIFKTDMDKIETDIFKTDMDKIEKDTCIFKTAMDVEENKNQNDSDSGQMGNCDKDSDIQIKENKAIDNQNFKSMNGTKSKTADDFILTGLHACGDLTPTFLRFFINCSAAKGLASVGCCYMKLSDSQTLCLESDLPSMGYPMSNFVRALPNHELSYNSRELACHFADTYCKRLRDNPPHLKIHSYRAALEWIANQLCPNFKRSAVQIPAKKTNKMDFKSYAKLGLQKLGISPDLLTSDLLHSATAMTERWKDVVTFYTLRLSLAPVVETLILLDRMMFLHEHGVPSILMPIFDPNISPRNFVLVAWK